MTLMFTDRVRKVFRLALENASRLNLEYISTDHLLLGIIEEGNSIAVQVLKNLRVDILEMQRALLLKTERGSSFTTSVGNLPQTPRVKRVVEGAIQLAEVMKHSHVGCYHLLAVLASQDCHTGKVLGDFGVSYTKVIEEITRIVQSSSPDDAVKLSITSVDHTVGKLLWLDDTPSLGYTSDSVPETKKEIDFVRLTERRACIGEIQQEMEEAKTKGDMTLACSLLRIINKLTPQWEGESQGEPIMSDSQEEERLRCMTILREVLEECNSKGDTAAAHALAKAGRRIKGHKWSDDPEDLTDTRPRYHCKLMKALEITVSATTEAGEDDNFAIRRTNGHLRMSHPCWKKEYYGQPRDSAETMIDVESLVACDLTHLANPSRGYTRKESHYDISADGREISFSFVDQQVVKE